MEYKDRFSGEMIAGTMAINTQRKSLEMLEHELNDIKENLVLLDEKQRILANMSKLYT